MHIRHRVETALRDLTIPPNQPLTLDVPVGQLVCELAAVDSIGCALLRIEVRSDRLQSWSEQRLQEVAQDLAQRLRYLAEPIGVVEFDRAEGVVQLRSAPPHRDESKTGYFELRLSRSAGISLCRYEKPQGEVRQPAAALMTHEILGRLAEDLAGSISD